MKQVKYKAPARFYVADRAFAAQQWALGRNQSPAVQQRVHIGIMAFVIEHYGFDKDGLLYCLGKSMQPFDTFKDPMQILNIAGYRLWMLYGNPDYHTGLQNAVQIKEILADDCKITRKGRTTFYHLDVEDQKLMTEAAITLKRLPKLY